MKKNPWLNDVAVLLIFFCRDEIFAKTFAAVKQARPKTLLLFQDGPRDGHPDDIEGIKRCRAIAEDIDWECTIYTNYQEKNYGCDPATFYSHKWAFSLVDACIILEDDCCPDQSFFPFCKELLDRYKNDTRINRICGMNNLANYYSPNSYFFSSCGSGPGFATWKRVADLWEENYDFLSDEYVMSKYFISHNSRSDKKYHRTCVEHQKEGIPHWETIYTYSCSLNNQLVIVPAKNLIHNIGLGENSAHSSLQLELILPEIRQFTYQEASVMRFPLKHPKYVFDDVEYLRTRLHIAGEDGLLRSKYVFVKSLIWRLFHGDFKNLYKGLKKHLYLIEK